MIFPDSPSLLFPVALARWLAAGLESLILHFSSPQSLARWLAAGLERLILHFSNIFEGP